MEKSIKTAVLFDLDGTLLDNVPALAGSVQFAVAEKLQQTIDLADVVPHIGRSLEKYLRSLLPSNAQDPSVLLKELRLAYERQYESIADQVAVFSGITLSLDELYSKYRLGLVTSRLNGVAADLTRTGLSGYFETIVTGKDVREHKPNPGPLILAAKHLGVIAANCVCVGDTVTDIIAAKAAQMASVAVTYGVHQATDFEVVSPGCLVNAPEEIADAVNHLLSTRGGTLS